MSVIDKKKFLSHGFRRLVGVHDALSCTLVESAGFEGIWASGLCFSASLGVPDANIVSFSEFAIGLRSMTAATKLPVIADCDTGFGDLHNVIHITRELGRAGVSGLSIEDKLFPKINSFTEIKAQTLESPERYAAKIKAASDNRYNENFMIFARIEALIVGAPMQEAIHRAELAMLSGADAIIIHSKKNSPEEIFNFSRIWNSRAPLYVIPTTYPDVSFPTLEEVGINGAICANQPFRAGLYAMKEYMFQLSRANSIADVNQPMVDIKEIFALQGMNKIEANEHMYSAFEHSVSKLNSERSKNRLEI